jgi:hypothetical protein
MIELIYNALKADGYVGTQAEFCSEFLGRSRCFLSNLMTTQNPVGATTLLRLKRRMVLENNREIQFGLSSNLLPSLIQMTDQELNEMSAIH